uniref:Tetratricopeptide TPR_1 repeat-containing protein n=1 Tax=Tolypothrix bouteillei VB521301 TaxID=1479485 RepID=A0A0C1NF08_9CYAN
MQTKRLRYLILGILAILSLMLTQGNLFFGIQIPKTLAATPDRLDVSRSPTALVAVGKQHYQNGEFALAIAKWQQGQQAFAISGDNLNQAAVLSNLALAYQQLGQWKQAYESIEQSLSILQNTKFSQAKSLLAAALLIQGSLQLSQGQAQQALTTWENAAVIYKQTEDKAGLSRCLLNQTLALRALGLYPRARKILEQVNQTLHSEADLQLKFASLLNLGETLRVMGELETSQEALQQALTIAQKLNLKADMAVVWMNLGNNARSQKLPDKAFQYYQQAIAASPSATIKLQAQLDRLHLLVETEKWQDARTLIEEIQPQLENFLPANRLSIYARVNFAQSLMKTCQNHTSRCTNQILAAKILAIAARQAEDISDYRAASYALGSLGEIYEQTQQWSEAQKLTEKALLLAQSSHASDIAYRWHWQNGRLLKVQGEYQKAILAYNEAVNTLSLIRNDLVASNLDLQFSFRESVEPVYRELAQLLLQPSPTQTEVSQENLKQARKAIESLQLAELDNYFREACLNGTPVQIDRLDSQAAVIYPIILSDRLEVVLSLPNQSLRHYATAIPQTQLETRIDEMLRSLRRTSLKRERLKISQEFYDLLIRPAQNDLKTNNIKTLAFVLDGAMKNLPMAALYDGKQYLIEQYRLALSPGLQLFVPSAKEHHQLKILVGGLSESRQGFIPLPGVESEVKQIKSEIPSQVLFNQAFTSTTFAQQIGNNPFPVVHLATHGQFSSNAKDTFVLTWDNRINVKQLGDLLQKREGDSHTPIELLVLSACQTAQGDKRAALGLAGVAIRSGARSTLASLWSVDDRSTSVFMAEFYKQLSHTGVSKAEAVRRAQLQLLKQQEFQHPFYWAPFVLVGNWL